MRIVENRWKSSSQSQHLSTVGVKAYAHATLNGIFSTVITNERSKRCNHKIISFKLINIARSLTKKNRSFKIIDLNTHFLLSRKSQRAAPSLPLAVTSELPSNG